MSFDPNEEQRLRDLQKYVGRARTITPGLMIDVIVRACVRFQTHDPTAKARVFRLIENGAFADATLGLLELDLPQWKLRRLIFGDGEWHCSLSKQLALPSELDQMAGGSHESLPLAILSAFIEARHSSLTESELQSNVVEQFRPAQGFAVCCDNFG